MTLIDLSKVQKEGLHTVLRGRLTKRRVFSRLLPVIVSLCAFAILPLPQFVGMTCAESSETECPFEEDGESSEEELVVTSSTRRRALNHRRGTSPFHKISDQPRQADSYGSRPQAIIGHQLANGLRAPLVI